MKENTVIVKKSKNGRGVFAIKKFIAQETIFEIVGPKITCYVDDDVDEKTRDNAIRFSKKYYINTNGELSSYLNHSCAPVSFLKKIKKRLFLKALKDIYEGEEITFDYSTTLDSSDIWTMQCFCGSAHCRATIKNFESLPKKIKLAYTQQGVVPKYVYDSDM
jgi:SET domain-containing protein